MPRKPRVRPRQPARAFPNGPPRRAPPLEPGGPGELPTLILPAALGPSLAAGHPWVYRDHVPGGVVLPSGTWVRVRAGKFSAVALWDAVSPIALRTFSRGAAPDRAWFEARVAEALALRRALLPPETSAFRLLFGEGDGMPGVTADVYGRYAVVLTYADSLDALLPEVAAALERALPLDGVLHKARRGREREGEERLRLVSGRMPPERLIVTENGIRFLAELGTGQKSGLFLDHRDNRAFVRGLAESRSVLNLFAYTGAFSVYAALGGATRVRSVDVASGAIAAARENFGLNGLDPAAHEFQVGDVFDELARLAASGRRFDLVISDPPSFASSRDKLHAALRAYTRLHGAGLGVVAPGGLYAAASCTAQVSPDAFRRALAEAALAAGVRFQIVHDAAHPADHPVFAGHPEGRYLKFVVGRVVGRV